MSRTFSNGMYSVTVNDDRSIRVKAGDWISKYSAAIYGDPLVNWNRFKRRDAVGRYYDLADPNKITAGELLWHPDPLPGEPRYGKPANPIGSPPTPVTPPPGEGLVPDRVHELFRYLKQWLCPVNDWTFKDNAGLDLSADIFAASYCAIKAERRGDPEPTWFHALGIGIDVGVEDFFGSISISPPEFPGGSGFIGKFPTAGRSLSADEICGNFLLLDFSVGCMLGWSPALLLFGLNTPIHAVLRTAVRYFRGEGDSLWGSSVWPSVFNGAILMHGCNWSTPNFGLTLKMGVMHRWECVTG